LIKFIKSIIKNEEGQSLVEFALVLPILLLLLCGIIDFGWIFGNQLLANNASREAARYTAVHYYDSTTDDDQATAAQIVADRAPTLISPTVTLTPSAGSVTIKVSSQMDVLTPIVAAFFENGKYTVDAICVMRLE